MEEGRRHLQILRFCQRNAKLNQETTGGGSYRLPLYTWECVEMDSGDESNINSLNLK